jgi:glycosyltransferase involved in cell wall biosynthesis
MDKSIVHRIRGLFFIDADKHFDRSHPHWQTISACTDFLSEIHVIVFTRGKILKKDFASDPLPKVVVYHISRNGIFLHFLSIWKRIMFNLRWRQSVRPHFVMNMTTGRHIIWAALFARYVHRPFFSVITTDILFKRKYTLSFWFTRKFIRRARQLFVSSDYLKMLLSTKYKLPQELITVSMNPINPDIFEATTGDSTIMFEHKGYNFFIGSSIESISEIKSFHAIYRHVEEKYPRTAGILFVENSFYKIAINYIKIRKIQGIFIYKKTDQFLEQLKKVHIYLSVSKIEDINISMLQALSLQVPVVTVGTGLAVDIFKGSMYEQFLVYTDDPKLLAHSVILLLENQGLRIEYGLNTKVLLDKAVLVAPKEYAEKLYLTLTRLIDPISYDVYTANKNKKNGKK